MGCSYLPIRGERQLDKAEVDAGSRGACTNGFVVAAVLCTEILYGKTLRRTLAGALAFTAAELDRRPASDRPTASTSNINVHFRASPFKMGMAYPKWMNHGRTLLDTDRDGQGRAVAAGQDRGRQARETILIPA